ncbi:hypothetical protein AOLI_G00262160, partial [Acnodon oligacanthus]
LKKREEGVSYVSFFLFNRLLLKANRTLVELFHIFVFLVRFAGSEENMVAFLLVVLLIAGTLSSYEAQSDFSKLPEPYRRGVELALEQVNSHAGVQNHFLFFKSLSTHDIDAGFGAKYFYHHFHLKPTRCRKGATDANHTKCPFRNDRPVIDCGMCYKTFHGVIDEEPKPYIHCIHKPTLTKEMISKRIDICNKMSYSTGSASVLLVKGTE